MYLDKSKVKSYIGAKIIGAELSNLRDYKVKKFGEKAELKDEDFNIKGYIVYYPGIGVNKNIYIGWSPVEVFETSYREIKSEEIYFINNSSFPD